MRLIRVDCIQTRRHDSKVQTLTKRDRLGGPKTTHSSRSTLSAQRPLLKTDADRRNDRVGRVEWPRLLRVSDARPGHATGSATCPWRGPASESLQWSPEENLLGLTRVSYTKLWFRSIRTSRLESAQLDGPLSYLQATEFDKAGLHKLGCQHYF